VQQQQQYVTGSPAVPSAQLAAQLQQMQLNGGGQAGMNGLLTSVSAQAEIMRQQAALHQAAADAANDRLTAYIAALAPNSAESMAAMAVAAGMTASSHAQQIMVQQQQMLAKQQQQHMLPSDQLMIMLDDQAAAAAGGPMLMTQGSGGMQQQYVLHGTPQASGDSLMAHHIPSTTWM
jgi:paraquat-inducible protein B